MRFFFAHIIPFTPLNSPPANRNKQAILEVLQKHLPTTGDGTVLEISSGSGQHIHHFAPNFPNLKFQPSEYPGFSSPVADAPQELNTILGSVDAYCEGTSNVLPAIYLDAASDEWATETFGENPNFAAVICINLCHISPFAVSEGLLTGSGRTLRPGGHLIIYGPFKFGPGPAEPESNEAFDQKLKSLDGAFGIRNVLELDKIASIHGLVRVAVHDMPANNHTLVYQGKDGSA